MHEWPIFIFTLCIQTSIGILISLGLIIFLTRRDSSDSITIFKYPLVASAFLGFFGLIASFWHLGYPFNAPNAIRNINSSWLSREIILTGAYIGLSCLIALLCLFKNNYQKYIKIILIIAIFFGVIDIFCMAQIYRTTSIVTWKSTNTLFLFFGTAINLGSLITIYLLTPILKENLKFILISKSIIASISFYGLICLILQPSYINFIQNHPFNDIVTFPIDAVTAFMNLYYLQYFRFGLLIIGLSISIYLIYSHKLSKIYLSIIPIFLSEAISRYAFFAIF